MAQNSTLTAVKRPRSLPPPSPDAIAQALGLKTLTVEWLAGDGSDRCYYRIRSSERPHPMVLMQLSGQDAQALKDNGYDWINVAREMAEHGIFVPKVYATMPEHAALVIEDYGDTMLEGLVYHHAEQGDFDAIRTLYQRCSEIIAGFLAIPKKDGSAWCRRAFDAERFTWELNFFAQKYLEPAAKIVFNKVERAQFEAETKALATALAANSRYFVHRDFHSRNVMVKDKTLAIIDFQDARLGPAAYDVVSLCFDSYVPFPAKMRRLIFDDALAAIRARHPETVAQDVERLWKPMLLQRQIKAIGSFGYLTIDKQRGDYLKYVDPALKTLEEQDVYDARWPLLSGELLKRMRDAHR